jgi:hypothetical protein
MKNPEDRSDAFMARRMAVAGWATAAVAIAAVVVLIVSGVQSTPGGSGSGITERLQRALTLAATPGSRIAIVGAPGSSGGSGSAISTAPNGLAVIPDTGAGALVMQGLPPTRGSEVYEVWAIIGGEPPAPIGSFAVGTDGLGWLDSVTVPPGDSLVVALTREPGPGATKPTLPIVASGSAA